MSSPATHKNQEKPFSTKGVIVTYHPDPTILEKLLESLAPQVAGGIIINNGPQLSLDIKTIQSFGFTVSEMTHNIGVAGAVNRGIEWARKDGASHVILFDQDSTPTPDMVKKLEDSFYELESKGFSPAAVGPSYEDRRTGRVAKALVADTQKKYKMMLPPEQGFFEVDMLITSGCLIPLSVIDKIGGMRVDLFIDHVDMEWCFRARSLGFKTFLVGDAYLQHCIGDRILKILTRSIIIHSPVRHYYMIRNGIALQRVPHMTKKWRFNISLTLIKQFFFYSIFLPERRKRIPLMLRGIRDGLSGRLGPLLTFKRQDENS